MKIFILIVAFSAFVQCNPVKLSGKNPAKRAILGQGHVESVHNSIADPNKNAYLPPPIHEYPLELSHTPIIEPPATTYLPPFETSPTHVHVSSTQNGFVPVDNGLGSQYASQYRASGYLPPEQDHGNGHVSHQYSQSHLPPGYRGPDYLPPKFSQPSDHGTIIQQQRYGHGHLPVSNHVHHHVENPKSTYNAPGYLPPISAQESHVTGQAQELSEGSYRAAGYLPPKHTEATHSNHGSYNAAGYLPPVHHHQPVSARVLPSADFEQPDSAYKAAGYLPPVTSSSTHDHHLYHQQPTDSPYKAAGYLPPVSSSSSQGLHHYHQQPTDSAYKAAGYLPPVSSSSSQQPTDSAYKAAGYLPPVTSSSSQEQGHVDTYAAHQAHQYGQVPHTVYGTPKSHSQTTVHIAPSVNTAAVSVGSQYAPSNSYSGDSATDNYSHYTNSAETNYKDYHQHQNNHHHYHQQTHNYQQIYSTAQNGYAPQSQAYAPTHHTPDTSYSVTSQSLSIPVPHDYTVASPMYPSNPTTQYASDAPTYNTNSEYLPPHTDLLPPTQLHANYHAENNGASTTAEHTNNGYLPPISTDYTAHSPSGNDIQFSTNHIQNSGLESSQQQYASSFPTYSTNHDGYDYSKPTGAVFEDEHQNHNLSPHNSIIRTETQPNLHVLNVGSEGAHQQDIKIIRIIDETKPGATPNIRTLKIIKETVQDEPNHSHVETIRIITEPSSSLPVSSHVSNPIVQTPVNNAQVQSVSQVVEQHENVQVSRAQSAGENVQGGYLPPQVILQSPVARPSVSPTSVVHQPVQNHAIPSISEIRKPANVPGYLPPFTSSISQIVQPGQIQSYSPPLTAPHNPPNVKTIRILHDNNYEHQQDAIYAGVAEHNGNNINTIRVIHQQEAATSGRYGYPSPHTNSVKLLRYYRRY